MNHKKASKSNFLRMAGVIFFFIISNGHFVIAQEKDIQIEDLFKMSMEELMKIKVKVPAAITKLSLFETPASIMLENCIS